MEEAIEKISNENLEKKLGFFGRTGSAAGGVLAIGAGCSLGLINYNTIPSLIENLKTVKYGFNIDTLAAITSVGVCIPTLFGFGAVGIVGGVYLIGRAITGKK